MVVGRESVSEFGRLDTYSTLIEKKYEDMCANYGFLDLKLVDYDHDNGFRPRVIPNRLVISSTRYVITSRMQGYKLSYP